MNVPGAASLSLCFNVVLVSFPVVVIKKTKQTNKETLIKTIYEKGFIFTHSSKYIPCWWGGGANMSWKWLDTLHPQSRKVQ